MAPTRRRLLAGLAGLAALAGCIGDDDPTDPTPTPPADDPTPTPAVEVAAEVGAFAITFEPDFVTIDVGETVRWTQEEDAHTVTLFHADNDVEQRAPEGADAFDLTLGAGTVEHTFETEGVHDYFCRPHQAAGMAGTVIVGEPDVDGPGLSVPGDDLGGAMVDRLEDLNARTREEFGLAAATVEVATIGDRDVLVGPDGMTLYMFDVDEQGAGASTCYDDCADAWPPLIDDAPQAGAGVTAELSTLERDDGTVQVAANGWPLYFFVQDEAPGDAHGQGVNDVWWALSPSGEPIREDLDGADAEPTPTPTPTPDDDDDDDYGYGYP